jgi:hypothetical protein
VYNTCGYYGGAGICVRQNGSRARIRNCLVANNTSGWRGGGVYVGETPSGVLLQNCTIVSNKSGVFGANGTGGGVCYFNAGTSINSIVYFNVGPSGTSNYYANTPSLTFWKSSCAAPKPTGALGTNCTAANPRFVSFAGGDFHLTYSSPCTDSGLYETWMAGAVDLDNRPRVQRAAVDMGVYELPPGGTAIFLY